MSEHGLCPPSNDWFGDEGFPFHRRARRHDDGGRGRDNRTIRRLSHARVETRNRDHSRIHDGGGRAHEHGHDDDGIPPNSLCLTCPPSSAASPRWLLSWPSFSSLQASSDSYKHEA